jgi:hypothetical protein
MEDVPVGRLHKSHVACAVRVVAHTHIADVGLEVVRIHTAVAVAHAQDRNTLDVGVGMVEVRYLDMASEVQGHRIHKAVLVRVR